MAKLKNHKMSIHEGIIYPCNQRELKFNPNNNLKFKTHKMSVSQGIKYLCNQCDMKLIINRPFGITQFQNIRLSNSHVINVN